MMDKVVPGGVTTDLGDDGIVAMLRELDAFSGFRAVGCYL
jgi:hypothetical protein